MTKITPKRIWGFFEGNLHRLIDKTGLASTTRKEQTEWRRIQVRKISPECADKGECYCGCPVEGLIAATAGCEEKNHCFPRRMNKENWEAFKKASGILAQEHKGVITITYDD